MKIFNRIASFAVLACSLLVGVSAMAATVTLPDGTQTTTFTATVSEQITVTVPAAVAFTVNDVTSSTAAAAATVTVTSMALTNGNHLRISISPDAASFTAPDGGTTWASTDVSWNLSTGTNYTGATGTMAAVAGTDTVVGNCTLNVNECSTADLVFTLAAKTTIDQAGEHTLGATWKFESVL